jgi:hypothetical protein
MAAILRWRMGRGMEAADDSCYFFKKMLLFKNIFALPYTKHAMKKIIQV